MAWIRLVTPGQMVVRGRIEACVTDRAGFVECVACIGTAEWVAGARRVRRMPRVECGQCSGRRTPRIQFRSCARRT